MTTHPELSTLALFVLEVLPPSRESELVSAAVVVERIDELASRSPARRVPLVEARTAAATHRLASRKWERARRHHRSANDSEVRQTLDALRRAETRARGAVYDELLALEKRGLAVYREVAHRGRGGVVRLFRRTTEGDVVATTHRTRKEA